MLVLLLHFYGSAWAAAVDGETRGDTWGAGRTVVRRTVQIADETGKTINMNSEQTDSNSQLLS